jgi:UDP-N-acetylmuramoyl-tripeptide--D-alanyl-D-alanine ligase
MTESVKERLPVKKIRQKPIIRVPAKPLILPIPVIAVTGSAGKTTTKEMIASILSRSYRVYKSMYNKNFLGNTRAHVRKIKKEHQAAVLEFGMLRSGNIISHCQIIRPSMSVITNIGTAHIGNVGGHKVRLAMAKSELIRHMQPKGKVFLNMDCSYSRKLREQPFAGKFAGTFITIGVEQEADYQATSIQSTEKGLQFNCRVRDEEMTFFTPVLGEHNIYNALFAIAVADSMEINPATIQEGLRVFRPQKKRLTHYRTAQDVHILDDTYSSNPNAAKAAIDALCQVATGTRVAVLASMMEMGKYEIEGHEDVGRYLCQKNIDYLYTLGRSARHIARGAIRAGFPAERVVHCINKRQLHRFLMSRLKPNTYILVRGSRVLHMGETVNFLYQQASKKQKMPIVHYPSQTPLLTGDNCSPTPE